jgi:hypothetical protein
VANDPYAFMIFFFQFFIIVEKKLEFSDLPLRLACKKISVDSAMDIGLSQFPHNSRSCSSFCTSITKKMKLTSFEHDRHKSDVL